MYSHKTSTSFPDSLKPAGALPHMVCVVVFYSRTTRVREALDFLTRDAGLFPWWFGLSLPVVGVARDVPAAESRLSSRSIWGRVRTTCCSTFLLSVSWFSSGIGDSMVTLAFFVDFDLGVVLSEVVTVPMGERRRNGRSWNIVDAERRTQAWHTQRETQC